jgi:hypothetical protein
MLSRSTSNVPKEDVIFPGLLYRDSICSQACPWNSLVLPGSLSGISYLWWALWGLSPDGPSIPRFVIRAPTLDADAPRHSQMQPNISLTLGGVFKRITITPMVLQDPPWENPVIPMAG